MSTRREQLRAMASAMRLPARSNLLLLKPLEGHVVRKMVELQQVHELYPDLREVIDMLWQYPPANPAVSPPPITPSPSPIPSIFSLQLEKPEGCPELPKRKRGRRRKAAGEPKAKVPRSSSPPPAASSAPQLPPTPAQAVESSSPPLPPPPPYIAPSQACITLQPYPSTSSPPILPFVNSEVITLPELSAPVSPLSSEDDKFLDDWNPVDEAAPFSLAGRAVPHNYGSPQTNGMVRCLTCNAEVHNTLSKRHEHAREQH